MNRKMLLTVVVMLCVTLVTACVSTRFFMSFKTVSGENPDPSQGQSVVNSMANQDISEVESEVREAWSLADKAAEERASNAAVQQQASQALDPSATTLTTDPAATDPAATTPAATDPAATDPAVTQAPTTNPPATGSIVSEAELDAVLANGETYKSLYSNACIVGDSVIAAITLYDFLDEPYCLGKVGASLYYLEENIETVVSLNPKHLILHFGTNMLNDSDDYLYYNFIGMYVDLCQQLEARMPGVHIVISSLLPMTAEAEASNSTYSRRYAYNDALREMCAEHGWDFMDNEAFALSHMDLIEPDGMHFQYSFYDDYWLKFIYLQAGVGA